MKIRVNTKQIMRIKLFAIFTLFAIMALPIHAQVKVRGYYRKDGTYVRPHTRSLPKQSAHHTYYAPTTTERTSSAKSRVATEDVAAAAKSSLTAPKYNRNPFDHYTFYSHSGKCLVRYCSVRTQGKEYGDLGYVLQEQSYMPYCGNHTLKCLAASCSNTAVLAPDTYGRYCKSHLRTCFQLGCTKTPILKSVKETDCMSIGRSYTGHCEDHAPVCDFSGCAETASISVIGYSRFCTDHANTCHVAYCQREAISKREGDFGYYYNSVTYTNLCSDHTPLCGNPGCSTLASFLQGGYDKFCIKHR
ncbi:hypothetical protein [Dawidia soli]|uniref:Uncharacterized protein n=1 Tax=Dawidia soli TaxID=2782352 RepID=A0AAP2DB48_9BACT|nr:hypothetical protein [Dawidia soli]MBT1688773.1 hypothetical protein [Dawidia soli]